MLNPIDDTCHLGQRYHCRTCIHVTCLLCLCLLCLCASGSQQSLTGVCCHAVRAAHTKGKARLPRYSSEMQSYSSGNRGTVASIKDTGVSNSSRRSTQFLPAKGPKGIASHFWMSLALQSFMSTMPNRWLCAAAVLMEEPSSFPGPMKAACTPHGTSFTDAAWTTRLLLFLTLPYLQCLLACP